MSDKLSLPAPDIQALGRAALDFIATYYDSLAGRRVIHSTTSAALRNLLTEPLPQSGAAFESLLETVHVIAEFSRHNGHPRFFGYVSSPGTPVAALGSMIESALNINVTCWRSGPAATELEHITINWLKEMLGYPAQAGGLLVSGGSMANFAGLAAARSAKAGVNVVRDGVAAVGRPMCLYVSEEGHFSIRKAAGMLGIGEANVRAVQTNHRLEIDLEHLDLLVGEDLSAGRLPFCVVANAGSAATGAFDPIGDLADFAHRHNLWLHVDAAYGGFACLAPEARPLFARIGEADSVALDPHKWLYLPVGCGCILYKNPAAAQAAFRESAEYTRVIGLEDDESFAFWDYGPELSRPFRALNLWLVLKYVGVRQLGEAIAHNMACARYLESLVTAAEDFELLCPANLSIVCFRYRPPNFAGDLNALNERVLVNLQRAGSSYVSNARIGPAFALRACVLNYRTTMRDMEILLRDIRDAARSAILETLPRE
jgi:glutamate/tyrosine decarboxylase-like PLP-dependent enzyme